MNIAGLKLFRAPIVTPGPRDVEVLWLSLAFHFRKGAGPRDTVELLLA